MSQLKASVKAPWPRGKRRHPVPVDWSGIRAAVVEAGRRRIGTDIARRVDAETDTEKGTGPIAEDCPSKRH
jgi:hypothetical protein